MTHLIETIAGLAGWRRALVAVLAGALSVPALPPFNVWPALFVTLPVLVLLVDGAGSWRRAAVAGWWWSLGHFVAGLYWIGIALMVDPERFAWLLPFADLGLPAVFAVFPAAAVALGYALGRRGAGLLFALAGAWVLGEFARGHVLTGFPWNPLAAIWIETPSVAQAAAVVGAYGLSGATFLVAGLPALFLRPAPGRAVATVAAAAVAVAVVGFGSARLPDGAAARAEPALRIRLVQGNIDQRLKHSDAARAEHFERHMLLSQRAAADGRPPRVVVWPETALPYTLAASPGLGQILGSLVGEDGIALIGAVRIEEDAQGFRAWNSLHAIRPDGTVAGTYDKHHLVPFGEYLPLRGILGTIGLDKLAVGAVDFSSGPGPQGLDLPGLPRVLPLICYEAIFPEAAIDGGGRPAWLVNVTNDAWFGTSSGPPQHLAAARLRAIEQGLPLMRAANTGISAAIDPYGRVEQALGLGVAGIIDADLPAALPPTLFSRAGSLAPLLPALVLLGLGLALRRRSA
ncbi:apolipoprotein N-acyltransferase [Oleomonas cavernae]|uniref:Apolipoprotein N-acyltransferase n=1 Tax=Oleomonas cavernae TaxID=2320859 RepID=A0A418WHP2_9PROT|nr:apolipoprotein N-acyltransferase [Oleomonas cavernae]RJF89556.1 apolipoprotein N-acyltransferase [Oleomonas cavernae]